MVKRNQRGITLIALVITIVVLIILAAVAINLSLGNNGIFNRAKTGKELYSNAQDYEKTEITKSVNEMDKYIKVSRENISEDEFKRIQDELNILKESFTGSFYLSGTADSSDSYSRSSYVDINVKGYNHLEINVNVYGDSSAFTCYVNGNGTKILDITSSGKKEIDITNYDVIRIYYYEQWGYYFANGTYTLSNIEE